MHMQTTFLLVCLSACGLAPPLWAQDSPEKDWRYKVEVFGSLGNGKVYHGDKAWGSGREYGGGIGARPFSGWLKRIGFEFEGGHLNKSGTRTSPAVLQNQTLNTAIFQNLDSRLLQGTVLYHFRSGTRVQPFASVGIGYVKADYSFRCENCVFGAESASGRLIPRQSEWGYQGSKAGLTVGGGLKLAINRHLSFRSQVQFVDTTGGSGINLFWLRLKIGLAVHF
jgi:opacity protein-like surface antigen